MLSNISEPAPNHPLFPTPQSLGNPVQAVVYLIRGGPPHAKGCQERCTCLAAILATIVVSHFPHVCVCVCASVHVCVSVRLCVCLLSAFPPTDRGDRGYITADFVQRRHRTAFLSTFLSRSIHLSLTLSVSWSWFSGIFPTFSLTHFPWRMVCCW